jgi:nucleoside-diphosphate-sugar epimerase
MKDLTLVDRTNGGKMRGQLLSEVFQDKRVLLVGASGFYGSHLAHRLASDGAVLFCVSRSAHQPEPRRTWIQGDFANLDEARRAIRLARPDVIYHLTSESRGEREVAHVLPSLRSDVIATVNSLAAAAEFAPSARFIMTTSMEEPRGRIGDPDSEPVAAAPYAVGKACAALYGRMFHALYALPVVILRPFTTYGHGQKVHKVVPYTILSLMQGIAPRFTSATRRLDYVYIDDMVDAFMRAGHITEAIGETLDIGTGELITVREMVEAIHARIGGPAPHFGVLPERRNVGARVAEVERRADNARAAEKLCWRPMTTLAVGLARTIEGYRNEIVDSHAMRSLKQRAYAVAALFNPSLIATMIAA